MKKKLLALILGLALTISACKKNDTASELINSNSKISQEAGDLALESKDGLDSKKDSENQIQLEDKDPETSTDPEPEAEEDTDEKDLSQEDRLLLLKDQADYISIIKMSQTGSKGREVTIIEDLKGGLKNIEFPDIKEIQANQVYLVFMEDSNSGDIVLLEDDESLIPIKDEYDQAVLIIRGQDQE